jgi:hypothetical protein
MAKVRSLIQKGRNYQKTTMLKFKEVFALTDDDIRTAVGSEIGEDIKLSKKARETIRLSIECKNMENMNIWSAIKQSLANCPEECHEAVIFKRGGRKGGNKSYICVPLDHYLKLREILFDHDFKFVEKDEIQG